MIDDDDFKHVRHSAAGSGIATAGRRVIAILTAEWATSTVGGSWNAVSASFARATPAARVRWWAITIAIAATAHIALRALMSSTVAPGMPLGVYVVIVAGSAVIAWQAEGFHRGWHGSRLSRLFHDRN